MNQFLPRNVTASCASWACGSSEYSSLPLDPAVFSGPDVTNTSMFAHELAAIPNGRVRTVVFSHDIRDCTGASSGI
jgi:hypothetical protein